MPAFRLHLHISWAAFPSLTWHLSHGRRNEPLHVTEPGLSVLPEGHYFTRAAACLWASHNASDFLGCTRKEDLRGLQRGPVSITGASALETEKHLPGCSCGYYYKNARSWHRELAQAFWNSAGHSGVRTSDPVGLRQGCGHKERIQTGDKKLHAYRRPWPQ